MAILVRFDSIGPIDHVSFFGVVMQQAIAWIKIG